MYLAPLIEGAKATFELQVLVTNTFGIAGTKDKQTNLSHQSTKVHHISQAQHKSTDKHKTA